MTTPPASAGANEEVRPMKATNTLRRERDHERHESKKAPRPDDKPTAAAGHGATWPPERVERLKSLINAGFSCSQIANQIGVTRNAVIGKMNRLGLSRPKDRLAPRTRESEASERKRAAWRPRVVPPRMLLALPREPVPRPQDIAILNGRGCSFMELGPAQCRWPINEPGAANFCFCGNQPVEGLPYCVGHARIAYKTPARIRIAVPSALPTFPLPQAMALPQATGSTESDASAGALRT
jgi:GcrA cell cycle regulator